MGACYQGRAWMNHAGVRCAVGFTHPPVGALGFTMTVIRPPVP